MKKITIADVAQHAGVSKSTVSQYLNERFDYMGEQTKRRVEEAIKELGYSPNIIARSLKQKSTTTIGVIVANILHVFSTQVIRAIEDVCNEKNYHVIVCNADDNPVKEKKYIEMLRAKQVDGIIAFPTGGNVALYQRLVADHYPVVFMDRLIPDIAIDTVLLDNAKAATLAVDTFIKRGHQKIAILSPPLQAGVTPRVERIDGYRKALQKQALSVNEQYIVSGEIEDMQVLVHQLFTLPEAPTAILALNDRVLYELLTYTRSNQLRIPEDIALIGIDDVSFASIYSPALTTIAQPAFEMGEKAAILLLEKIHDKEHSNQVEAHRFEPRLIMRESC
ncbi:LacI family DNA-binding transcriptional regulator [Oceanobacillus bengalensis]|uniref:LacI family transcriptional regulator n=1 Tax=Oceanobacillus bengalensis TaxID=1435466 RepID=A0A494YTU7_9BACI|nr:substrate-binding domain-containing protein [Oceanobacillus bengalensis]RKQ13569.1 LacI family transcriptional regulator [Oceanobacillus bengalensis]